MANHFNRFYTLDFEDGHRMQVLWCSISYAHGLPTPGPLKRYAYREAKVNARSLVLLNWTQDFELDDLKALLRTGATVVAYVEKGRTPLKPGVVIDRISERLLDCSTADILHKEDAFRARIARILERKYPYLRFTVADGRGRIVETPRSVFLATPYEEEIYRPFYDGCSAAMEKQNIRILNPLDEPGNRAINAAVLRDIDACDVVIANLRQVNTRQERGHNPNVWFEIGYAWKANKPVLLFRHDSDWLRNPSDVHSKVETYFGAMDLALQLYYGFGGNGITDGASVL